MFHKAISTFWMFWAFVWVFGIVAVAWGSPPLTITESGYYLTTVDSEGIPQYVKLTTVIDLTGKDDVPPPDNGPEIDLALAKQVQAWATEIKDPQAAQAMAAVYLHIKGAVEDDILTPDNVWPTLATSSDKALVIVSGKPEWESFREKITEVLAYRLQRGTLQTPKQIEVLLCSVQHGLELSADGSVALGLNVINDIAKAVNETIDANK